MSSLTKSLSNVFSPRNFVSPSFFGRTGTKQDLESSFSHFSYNISSDGIEVRHPLLERYSDRLEEISETSSSTPTTISSETEVSCQTCCSQAPFEKVGNDQKIPRRLCDRRGRPMANLKLVTKDVKDTPSALKTWTIQRYTPPAVHRQYQLLRMLQHGAEGSVALFKQRTDGQLRVVKSVRYPRLAQNKPIESCILQDIVGQHENFVRLHTSEFFQYQGEPMVQYYFEYCSGGDLWDLCQQYRRFYARIPEPFIWKAYHQLAAAIEFLHTGFDRHNHGSLDRSGVVHRDIKPQNILLRLPKSANEDPDFVLADFGSASLEFASYTPAGTIGWTAPEYPRKAPKSDVWGVGAVIYYLIHLEMPFTDIPSWMSATSANDVLWQSKAENIQTRTDVPDGYSTELIEMMMLPLEIKEYKRPSSKTLAKILTTFLEGQPLRVDGQKDSCPLAEWSFDHLPDDSNRRKSGYSYQPPTEAPECEQIRRMRRYFETPK